MGKKMQTEMMDVYYNTIFLICYNEMMFVLDILPNDTLAIRKAIQLTPNRIPHHGIRVHGEYVYITPSNMKIGYEHIVQYHIHSGAIRYLPSIGPNIRIKNIAFTQNEHAVMAINYKTETNMSMKNHTSHGALQLYAPNMQCIQSIKYPATHFDSICMAPRASQDDPEIFYAIGADGEGGYIYKGIIENNQIIGVKKYPCMDFPHGIDVHDNKIVYTSYATSSIEWIDINELD
jgi:hypothetical protein